MIDVKKQALMEAINEIPLETGFVIPNGFIVPLKNKILVKKVLNTSDANTTEGGIILPGASASNTTIPDIGIVYAVGPEVSDFVFPGLRIMYNPYVDFEIMIQGISYLRMDENDVYGVLPPKSFVYQGVRSEAYLRRVKRMKEFSDFGIRKDTKEANDQDKKIELSKKKK